MATSLIGLGYGTRQQGDDERARALYKEGLALSRELGDKKKIADCIEGLAGVAGAQGSAEQAVRLLGVVEGLREGIGAPLPPAGRARYEQTIAGARARIDQASFGSAWAVGRAQPLDEAIAEAMRVGDGATTSTPGPPRS